MPAWPEAKLQRETTRLLDAYGWYHFHDRAVNTSHNNEPGFPDILAVWPGPPRPISIVAELKSQAGKLSDVQHGWLMRLAQCGYPAFVWRPQHWDIIVEVITQHRLPMQWAVAGWYLLNEGLHKTVDDTPTRQEILGKRVQRRLIRGKARSI